MRVGYAFTSTQRGSDADLCADSQSSGRVAWGEGEATIKSALRDNDLNDWTPRTPTLLYNGTNDALVTYERNAAATYERFKSNGSNVVTLLLDDECAGHNPCGIVFLQEALSWFETFH